MLEPRLFEQGLGLATTKCVCSISTWFWYRLRLRNWASDFFHMRINQKVYHRGDEEGVRGSHCSLSENHAAFISGCSKYSFQKQVLVIAISLIEANLTYHWPFCSNEHGTSAAASWGGTDAFTCVTAARTLSRTICPASYPGVSVGLLISGQSSWILTVPHAGHS